MSTPISTSDVYASHAFKFLSQGMKDVEAFNIVASVLRGHGTFVAFERWAKDSLSDQASRDASPLVYDVGDATMDYIFKPANLTNVHDWQAVLNQVELTLLSLIQYREELKLAQEKRDEAGVLGSVADAIEILGASTLSAFQREIIAIGETIYFDDPTTVEERANRHFEEVVELMQTLGITRGHLHEQVEYSYQREPGDAIEEIGDATVTLVALVEQLGKSFEMCARNGLEKYRQRAPRIREKRKTRHGRGPLPGLYPEVNMLGSLMHKEQVRLVPRRTEILDESGASAGFGIAEPVAPAQPDADAAYKAGFNDALAIIISSMPTSKI